MGELSHSANPRPAQPHQPRPELSERDGREGRICQGGLPSRTPNQLALTAHRGFGEKRRPGRGWVSDLARSHGRPRGRTLAMATMRWSRGSQGRGTGAQAAHGAPSPGAASPVQPLREGARRRRATGRYRLKRAVLGETSQLSAILSCPAGERRLVARQK